MYRIAIAGIATECCTFSPLPTRLEGFRIWRGDDQIAQYPFLSKFPDAEIIPVVLARAIPGGPVEASAYQTLKTEFLDGLKAAGALDGVFLDMHGAMNVAGMDDAEGDWITAARAVVGRRLPDQRQL